MLKKTTAQKKIAKLKKRVRIVRGGTSAAKTFSIIPFLIDYAIKNPKQEISIVAQTIPHLRRGALRDFLKIMDMVGMYQDAKFNKSTLTYTFSNGSFIEFFSADNAAKLRGARRDVLFINECNNVEWESYYQLAIRTRKFIYLDYNPVTEFWVDTELIGDDDVEMITLTYKDNEALDLTIVKELEKAREKAATSEYWANWWRVYGLGEVGNLDGVIFSNWEIGQFDESLPYGYGMDFGFSIHPTVLVRVAVCNTKKIIYINEEYYSSTQLSTNDIKSIISSRIKRKDDLIVADKAEGRLIYELSSWFNIIPCVKGPDSVREGITNMLDYKFIVTENSKNTIKELKYYSWNDKKAGVPIDAYNHAIDSVRYIFKKLTTGKSFIDFL